MSEINTDWVSDGFLTPAVYNEDSFTSTINEQRLAATFFRTDVAFSTPINTSPVLDPNNAAISSLLTGAAEGSKVISVDQFNTAIFPGKPTDAFFTCGDVSKPLTIRFNSFGKIDTDPSLRSFPVPYASFPVHFVKGLTQHLLIAEGIGTTSAVSPNFSVLTTYGQTLSDGDVLWKHVGSWDMGTYNFELTDRNTFYPQDYRFDLAALAADGIAYDFKLITAGTTAVTEPVWPTTMGARVTDGTVVWENVGPWKGTTYGDNDLNGITIRVPHDIVPSPGDDGWSVIIDPSTDNAYCLWRAEFTRVGGFPAGLVQGGQVTTDEKFPLANGTAIGAPWVDVGFGTNSFTAQNQQGVMSASPTSAYNMQCVRRRPVGEETYGGTNGVTAVVDLQLPSNPAYATTVEFIGLSESRVGVQIVGGMVAPYQNVAGDESYHDSSPYTFTGMRRLRIYKNGTDFKFRHWDPADPEPTKWLNNWEGKIVHPTFAGISNFQLKVSGTAAGTFVNLVDNVLIKTDVVESVEELGELVAVTCTWGGVESLSGDGRSVNWAPEPWRTAKSSRSSGSGLCIALGEVTWKDFEAACIAEDKGDLENAMLPHALHFSTDIPRGPANTASSYLFPATTTDGFILEPATAIKQGQRLWLDCSDADIAAMETYYERIYARSARKFGLYCSDFGGARVATTIEYPWNAYQKALQKKYDMYGYIALRWPWEKVKTLRAWDGS